MICCGCLTPCRCGNFPLVGAVVILTLTLALVWRAQSSPAPRPEWAGQQIGQPGGGGFGRNTCNGLQQSAVAAKWLIQKRFLACNTCNTKSLT
jgi:hypothetical protein